jgi:site-specific recombinase XerD
MKRMQYSEAYIAIFRRICRRFAEYVREKGVENTFSEELGCNFLKEVYEYPPEVLQGCLSSRVCAGIRCVRILGEYRVYGTFARLRQRNQDCIRSEKDRDIVEFYMTFVQKSETSLHTKRLRIRHVKQFYDYMDSLHIENIKDITSQTISGYILSMQGISPVYAMHRLRTLKFYLKFLFEKNLCDKDLTCLIPRIKVPKNRNVPALWDRDEIIKMLGSIDRGSPSGKRNYAVLSLVIQLGIRISDIANLKLDNLKWERRELEFQQHKTGKRVIYPILNETGWAIIDYIRYARPLTLTMRHLTDFPKSFGQKVER